MFYYITYNVTLNFKSVFEKMSIFQPTTLGPPPPKAEPAGYCLFDETNDVTCITITITMQATVRTHKESALKRGW